MKMLRLDLHYIDETSTHINESVELAERSIRYEETEKTKEHLDNALRQVSELGSILKNAKDNLDTIETEVDDNFLEGDTVKINKNSNLFNETLEHNPSVSRELFEIISITDNQIECRLVSTDKPRTEGLENYVIGEIDDFVLIRSIQ